ncbi:hypothetical protein [uncultured Gimesia sp.]|uniref:hypothetical protein n=1 Tax=uncultured Gimesia sp. TaxID=1678688 RepID=UPI0030DBD792|tara:strand:+ start:177148 stop:177567 length:420 start_codon:yes stop_codon:yes gene_type:complete
MRKFAGLLFSLILVFTTGCSGAPNDTPKTVEVKGVVTIAGNPISDATIVFLPKSGPSAVGRTDQSGAYTLKTGKAPGATPGQHTVTITPGGEIPMPGTAGAKTDKAKPAIPPAYGDPKKSGLTADVKATGENVIDFKLN